MSDLIRAFVKPLVDRLHMVVQTGRISAVTDSEGLQQLQLRTAFGDVRDGVARYQNYGFTAVPPSGSQAVMVAIGGLRHNAMAIAVDAPAVRPTGLQPGDVALYNAAGLKFTLGSSAATLDGANQPLTVTNVSSFKADTSIFKVTGDVLDHCDDGTGKTMAQMRVDIGDATSAAAAASTTAAAASSSATEASTAAATALATATSAGARAAGALQATSNLSDLSDVTAARSSLGLAAIATSGSASDLTGGMLATARLPAFAGGDVTSAAGSAVLALPAVNANVGTFNKLTVGAKGLVLAAAMLTAGDITTALGYTPLNPANNLTDLSSVTSALTTLRAGAASGLATLDATGKIPLAQIPTVLLNSVQYIGTWNASTNSPALASGVGTNGNLYVVATAGTSTLDGIASWNVGDWLIFEGVWKKIDGVASEVLSVAGRVGAVVLSVTDITGAAPLASPLFTGIPTAPTAGADTNTTQLATTAYVLGQGSAIAPIMNGTAAIGTSTRWARADHVHPTDTTLAPKAGPSFTGGVTVTGGLTADAISTPSLTLGATTTSLVQWGAVTGSTNPPAFTTRSTGTRVVLYPDVGSAKVDYALGIDAFTLWFSIPAATSSYLYTWYAGTTVVGQLTGDGRLGIGSAASSDAGLYMSLPAVGNASGNYYGALITQTYTDTLLTASTVNHGQYTNVTFGGTAANQGSFATSCYGQRISISTAPALTASSVYGLGSVMTLSMTDGVDYTVANALGMRSNVVVGGAAATATATNAYGHYSEVETTGGTITNGYGYFAQLVGSSGTYTMAYGLRITATGTIGTVWGVYSTGETASYLSGSLYLGTGGSAATPGLTLGSLTSTTGLYATSGSLLGFAIGGTSVGSFSTTALTLAGYLIAPVTTGIAAAGTTQAAATTLTKMLNVVSTATSGSAVGVKLMGAVAGLFGIMIANTTAIAINVYPPSGAAINALGSNVAYSLPAGKTGVFFAASSTLFYGGYLS